MLERRGEEVRVEESHKQRYRGERESGVEGQSGGNIQSRSEWQDVQGEGMEMHLSVATRLGA